MPLANFITSDFRRQVADAGALILKNRYFEKNPFLSEGGVSLVARPAMRRLVTLGEGPIRGMASKAGSFDGDLFVASGEEMYRLKNDLTNTMFYNALADPERGVVNMAITAQIGTTPEFLFVADGVALYVYVDDGYAYNVLTGAPANNDVVRIDNTYYQFTNASVDAGTPAGTLVNPWLVALGVTSIDAFGNLHAALDASGLPGTDYSTALTVGNPNATGGMYTASTLMARARVNGLIGNGIVTTETGAGLAWTLGGTMANGGSPTFLQVLMPEDIGVIDVAFISSYVIVIPAQDGEFIGRFYWIEPGETTVDPLNFATAERSPDGINGAQVFGDQFWLAGAETTEPWYVTGNFDAPMLRSQGVVYDRGAWENTARAVHETLVTVDSDGGVFLIRGGSPERVSTPDIAEQIRRSIALQQAV